MTCRVVCSLLLAIVAGLIQGTIAVPEFCSMEPETGNCEAAIKRWFFNSTINTCEIFIYGGCGGNDNNFEEREVCERKCRQCPVYDCPMDSPSCPNGYKKDEYGCQTCECRTERGRPCMNHKCGPGEKCMDTLMVPGPHCINIKENKKMCNRVCMDFCNKRAPMIADLPCPPCNCPEDACKTMLCQEGKTCESKVVCKGKSKCHSQGRCARNNKVCPALPPGTIGTCDEFCGNDSDCVEGEKCCSNGCGHHCMTAVNPPRETDETETSK